ncbi:hypothetical protein SMD44_06337 [Streptomyces alboflavus]|uniref:Uncharacterized protein n=1 Tax=Streptomyces alboflavus TaxID=67267 RepID=A0A1Z1WKE2_9ACTN|nr:hypothetical protein SMD44_06337 [Streptomyces alboflavus]
MVADSQQVHGLVFAFLQAFLEPLQSLEFILGSFSFLAFQAGNGQTQVLAVRLVASHSRNAIEIPDHIGEGCDVFLALFFAETVPPLLALCRCLV